MTGRVLLKVAIKYYYFQWGSVFQFHFLLLYVLVEGGAENLLGGGLTITKFNEGGGGQKMTKIV